MECRFGVAPGGHEEVEGEQEGHYNDHDPDYIQESS